MPKLKLFKLLDYLKAYFSMRQIWICFFFKYGPHVIVNFYKDGLQVIFKLTKLEHFSIHKNLKLYLETARFARRSVISFSSQYNKVWHGRGSPEMWSNMVCERKYYKQTGYTNYTVDSRYLEVQGTLWNASRYPYLDISHLRNWEKQ